MQIESIKKRSSNGDILLMGDLAQATGVWLYSSWQQLADLLGEPISRFDELEFGYRVPKQIFEYATKVLSYIDPKLKYQGKLGMEIVARPDNIVNAVKSNTTTIEPIFVFSKGVFKTPTVDDFF